MSKFALVLSGGGSKGAYEIGVYMALKKMKKNIDIVTGTSIGAINGVFIVQNDLRHALKLWKKISFSVIYNENDFPLDKDLKLPEIYMTHLKNFINEGGTDPSKLSNIFEEYFKPKKFFTSKMDFGLVTYNLTKNKPILKTKKDLNQDNIKDYVIASASCYPAFKPHVINDELYIDGGYYDNIPINLAIKMGADEVVAVDLRAIGFKKRLIDKGVSVTYIAPRNYIPSFLIFDSISARHTIKLGYNDAMKTFGKLDGDKLTFKKGQLVKNYEKNGENFKQNLHFIFDNTKNEILKKLFETDIFQNILNQKTSYNNFNYIVEKAGLILNFDESIIYRINSYNRGLLKSLSEAEQIEINKIVGKLKDKKIDNLIDHRQIVKFFYDNLQNKNKITKYIPLFTDDFLVAIYIYTVKGKHSNY